MKKRLWLKLLSVAMAVITTAMSLPLQAFAQTAKSEEVFYLKEIRLAQAETREEAKISLEDEGFTFLDNNLNEGTDEEGVWLGYTTTTDPTEAIYDMKLMNMNGGFTLTSMEEVIKLQETAFAEMAADLELLIKEFVKAYEDGILPAQKAYKALNFFRMVEGESELNEINGLGYQMVNNGMSTAMITEIIMFCDPTVVDSIVKILTMGIQTKNENWMKKLSELGPYNSDFVYGKDDKGKVRLTEDEIKRRAEQLETVVKFYADAYNGFDELGLVSGTFDEKFNIKDATYKTPLDLTADELAAKKADEARYKFYKVVFDELATYSYGAGKTLKDFFKSKPSAKQLYPLVSVLSDGEYSAMSYGCFLEVATGASAKEEDFKCYDEVYEKATEEVDSIYLYIGVDKALLSEDSIVGFTDKATRHMAATGELEFYENETLGEAALEKGLYAAQLIGVIGLSVMGVAKVTMGVSIFAGMIVAAVTGAAVKSAVYAGVIKICSVIGGPWAFLIVAAVAAVTVLVSWLISVIDEAINGKIDWDDNPMPEYLYDVKEVGFTQQSENEGVKADHVKRPVFGFYEAVRDENGDVVDLNAHSDDASQWIGLYVSYDRLGDDAKPIKAEDLKVKTGNGETPDGYKPLTRFDENIAYDLNQWDDENDVNGIYMFYKQDETAPPVEKEETYYVSDVYLQSGESSAHCIALLEKSGYTPLDVNLTPDCFEDKTFYHKPIYTYLGYKVSTVESSAVRDIRLIYGPNQGEIKLGAANYAECGSNGWVTLYYTKYTGAGSPILAGGIKCVNDRDDAPAGYEPVNLFGGGPAVSLNYRQRSTLYNFSWTTQKGVEIETPEFFLYFLPKQSFTAGTKYVGGISYFYVNNDTLDSLDTSINFWGNDDSILRMSDYMEKETGQSWENYYKDNGGLVAMTSDYLLVRSGYHTKADSNPLDSVLYYETYNPYRAIYDIKGTSQTTSPNYFSFENIGYASWNTLHLSSIRESEGVGYQEIFVDRNEQCTDVPLKMAGRFYVSGNPDATNIYNSTTGEMSDIQPLKVGEVVCDSKSNPLSAEDMKESAYQYITDVFMGDQTVAVQNNADRSSDYDYGINTFKFYVAKSGEDRPYVTGVFAADELTIYRASGGADKGMKRDYVTDDLLYRQLAAQGATNFCGHRVSMGQPTTQKLFEMNALRFGYSKSADESLALTDMFIYVNDFSFDSAPTNMYRNGYQYKLLCEIPYNLTGYDGAPGPGVWLYGTTDERAGAKIVSFEVSGSPFDREDYETLRTQSGRSPWSHLHDIMENNQNSHFLGWASELFEDLKDFFGIMDRSAFLNNYFEHAPYYFHIKREGEPLSEQKPYIKQLYVRDCTSHQAAAIEKLFDAGAEVARLTDLNTGAGGTYIYLGYSRTASVEDAIKNVFACHSDEMLDTMYTPNGTKYTRVSGPSMNYGTIGDPIHLYTSTQGKEPLIGINPSFTYQSESVYTLSRPGGKEYTVRNGAVTRWDNGEPSDLNANAPGEHIYLYQMRVVEGAEEGSYLAPIEAEQPTVEREGVDKKHLDPNGKYIAELYVMDKETIRKQKNYSLCCMVSDTEVFNKLKEMGATEILPTPISVNSRDFDVWNDNKVYIGYSRTNVARQAIKDIVIHVELVSHVEPKEDISVNKKGYDLVAEAAEKVTTLPSAINLLSIGDGRQVAFPKMYLYTYSVGTKDPITDICIDKSPLREGWNTVRSSNGIDAFIDVQNQAHEQYLLADKDDLDSSDEELVYTDSLFEWMDDVSAMFDPAEENVTTFYLHTKTYETKTIEETKPYIEELYLAAGDSRHDALAQLVEFKPDGFVDTDLNQDAGGKYVYLAYKRTDDASSAIRDLMICKGADPELIRRVDYKGIRIRYDLVANVDLNAKAGGPYLYLYYSELESIGNPVKKVCIVEDDVPTYSVHCGLENIPVYLVEDNKFTSECPDLNVGASGDYIYMYMQRETDRGHYLTGYNKRTEHKDPTCGKDGYHRVIETCFFCGQDVGTETVLPATGKHVDAPKDGDHRCDVCRQKDVTSHVRGEAEKENVVPATCTKEGSYNERIYCTDCNKLLSDKYVVIEKEPHTPGKVEMGNHKDPTCGTNGYDIEITYCSVCGVRYQERIIEIPATGDHSPYGYPFAKDRVEGTCSKKGHYTEVIKCSICGMQIDERIVDLGYDYFKHSPGDPVEEDRIEPKDGEDGSFKKVVYCKDCGAKISEETVLIPYISDSNKFAVLGSIMGEGSVLVLCILTAGAVLAAFIIFMRKKKKK